MPILPILPCAPILPRCTFSYYTSYQVKVDIIAATILGLGLSRRPTQGINLPFLVGRADKGQPTLSVPINTNDLPAGVSSLIDIIILTTLILEELTFFL